MLDTQLCSGYGQYHTFNHAVRNSKPYVEITISRILEMVKTPQLVDKSVAQWVIPHTCLTRNGRSSDFLRNPKNSVYDFHALWFDIDSGNPSLDDVKTAIHAAFGNVQYAIYATKSSSPQNQKWRGLFQLDKPISGQKFELCQTILNRLLQSQGLQLDTVNQACNQILYLPNRGDHYQYHINNAPNISIDFFAPHLERLERERAETEAKEEASRKARLEAYQKQIATLPENEKRDEAYVKASVEGRLRDSKARLAQCPDGEKHKTLLREAMLIGGYLHFGYFTEKEAIDALVGAIEGRCSSVKQAQKTAQQALRKGDKSPISRVEILSRRKDKPVEINNKAPKPPQTNNKPQRAVKGQEPFKPPTEIQKSRLEPDTPQSQTLPDICISNVHLPELSANAVKALLQKNNPPYLFSKSGQLVRLSAIDTDGNLELQLVSLDVDKLKYELERCATYYRLNQDGEKVSRDAPTKVAKDILAASDFPDFPALSHVITAPCLAASERIIKTAGYDQETSIYYFQSEPLSIPDISPTPENIDKARGLIDELMIDFPFVGDADKSHAIALLILPFVRNLIDGNTPMHFFTAPTPRTGKSLLAEAICKVSNPLLSASTAPSGRDSDEEWRKAITTALLAENPHIWFDNVKGMIDSSKLEQL